MNDFKIKRENNLKINDEIIKTLVFQGFLFYNIRALLAPTTHIMDSLIRALVPKLVDDDRLSEIRNDGGKTEEFKLWQLFQ